MEEFSTVQLDEFYQLPNTEEQQVKISFHLETLQIIDVSIHYTKNYKCPLFDLPNELIHLIKEYIPDIIYMELKATVPNDYPFKPHLWEMLSLKTNLKINKLKYYDIIKEQNCYNLGDWSPSMSIDKDILSLIEKYYKYLYQ
jgi:hypothetical protein